MIKGGTLSGDFCNDKNGRKPTLADQTKVASSGATGYMLTGSDSTINYAWSQNSEVAYFTFTLTAVKKCTVKSLTANLGSGQTGNSKAKVYFGSDDETGVDGGTAASNKLISVSASPSATKTLNAEDTLVIKIAFVTTGSNALSKTGNNIKVVCGDIVVAVAEAE